MLTTLNKRYGRPNDIPREVIQFIQYLDLDYPHQCIKADETPEQAHRKAGLRERLDDSLALIAKHKLIGTSERPPSRND